MRFVAASLATSVLVGGFLVSQVGRGANVSTAPGDEMGPLIFFRRMIVGSESKQPCFLMRQSRLACGILTKPAAVTPLHAAFTLQGAAAVRRPRNRSTT